MVVEEDHQLGEGNDVIDLINWDSLFDGLPNCDDFLDLEPHPILDDGPSSSPDSVSSWIGEIENMLMKEDDNGVDVDLHPNQQACDDFLAEILGDSPSDASGEIVDVSTEKDSSESEDCSGGEGGGGGGGALMLPDEDVQEKTTVAHDGTEDVDEIDGDDPVSKKRRRQLRNRDAAVRSRERKKMYVRDLELKSKYLEGECRRLDRLLQCFIAENQALRLTVHKYGAPGVTSAKQESAVLLLESLLLGSLLWFLGIMCLFILPALPQSVVENAGRKAPEMGAPRGAKSKIFRSLLAHTFVNGRRCKGSRIKMRAVMDYFLGCGMSCHLSDRCFFSSFRMVL